MKLVQAKIMQFVPLCENNYDGLWEETMKFRFEKNLAAISLFPLILSKNEHRTILSLDEANEMYSVCFFRSFLQILNNAICSIPVNVFLRFLAFIPL